MELAQHVLKKGELEKVDPDACLASILEEFDEDSWIPLTDLLCPENAQRAAPLLRSMIKTKPQTRRQVASVIKYLLQPGNYAKSESTMCQELSLEYRNWYATTRRYPAIWKFINLIVIETSNLVNEARVHTAVVESAINGGHQDRRLYLELTKKISRAGSASKAGGVNIVFVQDSMQRPEARVEDDKTIITLDSAPEDAE